MGVVFRSRPTVVKTCPWKKKKRMEPLNCRKNLDIGFRVLPRHSNQWVRDDEPTSHQPVGEGLDCLQIVVVCLAPEVFL